jgi:DNA-binding response OmpR family regulator
MDVPPIIVTNHDAEYLEMVQELLDSEGYPRVVCVPHQEAWHTILQEPPRLVFIDISLRDPESGWALLDKLRLHSPTADTPVILCATDARILLGKAAHLQRLSCSILEKPFLIDDLLALVRKLIGPPPVRERTWK